MQPPVADDQPDVPNRGPVPDGHALVEIAGKVVTVKTTPPPPRRHAKPLGVRHDDVPDGSLIPRRSTVDAPGPGDDRVPQDISRTPALLALVTCAVLVAVFAAVLFLG